MLTKKKCYVAIFEAVMQEIVMKKPHHNKIKLYRVSKENI